MQDRHDDRRMSEKKPVYAGFWVRLAAYLLDSILVFAALLIFRILFFVMRPSMGNGLLETGILFSYTITDIFLYAVKALYFILCTYCTGTTVGKRLMNLRVISADTGRTPGFMDLLYRETIGRYLSGLLMGLGYIVAGVSAEKCGFHDMLCDTRVIYEKRVKVSVVYPSAMASYVPVMQPGQPQNGTGVGGNAWGMPGQPQQPGDQGNIPEEQQPPQGQWGMPGQPQQPGDPGNIPGEQRPPQGQWGMPGQPQQPEGPGNTSEHPEDTTAHSGEVPRE